MKFTIETKALLKELRLLSLIRAKNRQIPVLANLKIEVGEFVTLTKTDLDLCMVSTADATKTEAGACLVDAALLRNVAASITDELLHIELVGQKLRITAGKAEWNLETVDAVHFPETPTFGKRSLTIPLQTFRDALSKVLFVPSNEQSRFTLSCVKCEVNGAMKLVATDGHRLALVTVPEVTGELDVMLSKRALEILAHFPASEELGITVGEFIVFEVDQRTLISKPISGQFPNYQLVIPKDNPHSASFDAIALTQACKQALTAADKRFHAMRWTLNKGGISDITADGFDRGGFKTQVVTNYQGETQAFALNLEYLLDFCKRQNGVVHFTMKDANAPFQFKVGNNYEYILMPLRT